MAKEAIFVVEDEQDVADLITRTLGRSGYRVAGGTASGEEALREVGQVCPDLVLMDINLQGDLDGVRTAELIRLKFDVPVVFLTGLGDDETLERSQQAKAFGYVVKPFRPEDLKASIELAFNKHQVESKLRQIERWFTAAIRSIGDGIITTDQEDRVTFLNPVAESLTGWTVRDARASPLRQVFHLSEGSSAPGDVSGPSPTRSTESVSAPEPEYPHLFFREATLLTREGDSIPIEASSAPIRDDRGAIIGRVLGFRDIRQRKRSEQELRHSREELRSLAAHVEQAREEDRTRIAREIHDELGQVLTGLRMDLSWMEKRVASIADDATREPLVSKTGSMFELLDQMVRAVRKISADLRPGVLDDLGLVPALEWQAREWQSRTGIPCRVEAALQSVPVPIDCGTALFRIFQESLTNVARHAEAREVVVHLGLEGSRLVMEVKDDGRGFTPGAPRPVKSFGLLGMRERSRLLGGDCQIEGVPGQGTTVRVTVPLAS